MDSSMPPEIQSYCFGNIEIDGKFYRKDIIIFPDRVRTEWWRKEGHNLIPEDLQEVFAADADILIVGQGAYTRMRVPESTRKRITEEGFELHVLSTSDAVEMYNQRREQERVIAALHLTC
jgi:hypothetical protein